MCYNNFSALFTDLYALTMLQGYYKNHKDVSVVFDMFFRSQPFENGFSIFAGLTTLLQQLENLAFSHEDIAYLRSKKLFDEDFLLYLKNFKFSGTLYALLEGSVCFPFEPLIRVHASIMEAQLIEGVLLNNINYQTLIATKSARICLSARGKKVVEFGLRRAHGYSGALLASRAAYIGGASASSNVLAGKEFDIPVTGTMSHAWVMSFDSEIQAFEEYAKIYPDTCVFVLDTYDTIASGIKNAITVGKKLQQKGNNFGVRLDSGDIEYLSQKVRAQLDDAGLSNAFIVASNELDEKIIAELTASNCPVDTWGVGTNMVTGDSRSSFSGVYKLSARTRICTENSKHTELDFIPVMKISNAIQKSSLPTIKQVYRYSDVSTGLYVADIITTEVDVISKKDVIVFHHPYREHEHFTIRPPFEYKPLLQKVMEHGRICIQMPSMQEIRIHAQEELSKLHKTIKRRLNPHIYHVSISTALKNIRDNLLWSNNNNG